MRERCVCLVTMQNAFPSVGCDQKYLEAKDLNISDLPSPLQSEAVFLFFTLPLSKSHQLLSNLQNIEHMRHETGNHT